MEGVHLMTCLCFLVILWLKCLGDNNNLHITTNAFKQFLGNAIEKLFKTSKGLLKVNICSGYILIKTNR